MASDFIETSVDKFVFKVSRYCLYNEDGVWVRKEGESVRVGLTDFVQQSSGDMAFVEVMPSGTTLAAGDDLCSIETIKVAIGLRSPISGTVREVNAELETSPELVNQDPHGAGWLALIDASDWDAESARLLDAESYVQVMRGQAEEEMRKR